jgi:hypothetical protein
MKGVVVVVSVLVIALMGGCGIVLANPPLVPPIQYEQFCEAQKVAGTGIIDVSTSIIDKKIALEYYNTMAGDGDLELDSEHLYSQNPEKIAREIDVVNNGKKSGMNLIETTKMTYAGDTPLVGGKLLNSKAFYGGIGAEVQEMFSVYEMEKDQTSFFASTTPYNPKDPKKCDESICKDCCAINKSTLKQDPNAKVRFNPLKKTCEAVDKETCEVIATDIVVNKDDMTKVCECEQSQHRTQSDCELGCQGKPDCDCDKKDGHKGVKPEDLIGKLERAGRDGDKVEELMTAENGYYVPSHVIGIDTKNAFNGTWGTDANWHKIFYKDIKAHEMFTGTFEAEKTIKFHENPVPEKEKKPCDGVDC